MLRRQFLQTIAALAVAPVLPTVLPEPKLPAILAQKKMAKVLEKPLRPNDSIRGMRANNIICDEYAHFNKELYCC